jgi:hypothetical protein
MGERAMTDIIPNDLSHMSDEDFNALCPQGHHAPGPEPLSPAALSVWCRFCEVVEEHGPPRLGLAAALRAAALYCKRDSVILLSLADELEQ